jgi:hypothetical protein
MRNKREEKINKIHLKTGWKTQKRINNIRGFYLPAAMRILSVEIV